VVAVADSGESLVESAQRLQPDLVITDLSMPGLGGLEAIRRLGALSNKPGIIVFTMHRDPALAAEAFRAGAKGYVLKHSAGTELLSAIDEVLAGRAYVTPQVGQEALGAFGVKTGGLTPRQREVLRFLGEGLTMKEVAARLDLSTRTVETHKYEIMRQLGARSTADLVKHALRLGLIQG
jgi:DNA-binding NarL/FixJ family response regulator